jgi:hypothetical protein
VLDGFVPCLHTSKDSRQAVNEDRWQPQEHDNPTGQARDLLPRKFLHAVPLPGLRQAGLTGHKCLSFADKSTGNTANFSSYSARCPAEGDIPA